MSLSYVLGISNSTAEEVFFSSGDANQKIYVSKTFRPSLEDLDKIAEAVAARLANSTMKEEVSEILGAGPTEARKRRMRAIVAYLLSSSLVETNGAERMTLYNPWAGMVIHIAPSKELLTSQISIGSIYALEAALKKRFGDVADEEAVSLKSGFFEVGQFHFRQFMRYVELSKSGESLPYAVDNEATHSSRHSNWVVAGLVDFVRGLASAGNEPCADTAEGDVRRLMEKLVERHSLGKTITDNVSLWRVIASERQRLLFFQDSEVARLHIMIPYVYEEGVCTVGGPITVQRLFVE